MPGSARRWERGSTSSYLTSTGVRLALVVSGRHFILAAPNRELRMRKSACGAALAVALFGCSDQATGPTTSSTALRPVGEKTRTSTPKVHIVYLVPAGVRVQGDYIQNLRDAAVNLQAWYSTALGTGETFTLASPTVAVYQTEHEASWYATTPASLCFPPTTFAASQASRRSTPARARWRRIRDPADGWAGSDMSLAMRSDFHIQRRARRGHPTAPRTRSCGSATRRTPTHT